MRDKADKAKGLIAVVNKAVLLIRRNKDNAVPSYQGFFLLTCYHPPPGKNKYLVFPRVRMMRSRATRFQLKDTHTEIWRSVISGNNLTLNYSG